MSWAIYTYMSHVYQSFIAQWLEHLTGVQKVIGSIPVEDSDFPLSRVRDTLITSFLNDLLFKYQLGHGNCKYAMPLKNLLLWVPSSLQSWPVYVTGKTF